MAHSQILWTLLPFGRAPRDGPGEGRWRVSAVVSPRLTPEADDEQVLKGLPTETAFQYLANARFWFESFQNWQSEFLSVFAIVILSVFLRQKGSPQSKPVDARNSETGEKS